MNGQPLRGGFDRGADLVDGTLRRSAGSWTPSVHHLLSHLAAAGFSGAPRPLGRDPQGREALTFLEGQTVGKAMLESAAAGDAAYQRMLRSAG